MSSHCVQGATASNPSDARFAIAPALRAARLSNMAVTAIVHALACQHAQATKRSVQLVQLCEENRLLRDAPAHEAWLRGS
jgi:hypothetical protein